MIKLHSFDKSTDLYKYKLEFSDEDSLIEKYIFFEDGSIQDSSTEFKIARIIRESARDFSYIKYGKDWMKNIELTKEHETELINIILEKLKK